MKQAFYIFLFLLLSVFAKTQDNTYFAITQTITKQDSNLYCEPLATFSASPNQNYGFDTYSDKYPALKSQYQTLNFGSKEYIVPYKALEAYKEDYVKVSTSNNNVYFKTDLGIPLQVTNGEIKVRGTTTGDDKRAIYAYLKVDSTEKVVGKLNLLSYDLKNITIVPVSVNGATIPDKLQDNLNKIYKQAVLECTVDKTKNSINVEFSSGSLSHGGGLFTGAFSSDEEKVLKAYKNQIGEIDGNKLYLFFVKGVKDKGNAVGGYMPLGYNTGFIFGTDDPKTIAHELSHGAFSLYHTFSDGYTYQAPERSTPNLMDYSDGSELAQHQWALIHNPNIQILTFLMEQSESESKNENGFCVDKNIYDEIKNNLIFIAPNGKTFTLPKGAIPLTFYSNDSKVAEGSINSIYYNGNKYFANYKNEVSKNNFIGYGSLSISYTGVNPLIISLATNKKVKVTEGESIKEIDYDETNCISEKINNTDFILDKSTKFLNYCNEKELTTKNTELVNQIATQIRSMSDFYDDYEKFVLSNNPYSEWVDSKENLDKFLKALQNYYEKHKTAKEVINNNCPDCPKHPVNGDSYWDKDGRNWIFTENKWIDLSGEFVSEANDIWKKDIDVQQTHKDYYEEKLAQIKNDPIQKQLGYTDEELFKKNLWRSTQFIVVRILKDEWVEKQVGRLVWVPIAGSLKSAYEKYQISENDQMLKVQALIDAGFGIGDVALVKSLAVGLYRFSAWAGTKIAGSEAVYLAKKQLITAQLSLQLSLGTPEATNLLSKTDDIIEIVSKADNLFIKYETTTGKTLVCSYKELGKELVYKDLQTIKATASTEEAIAQEVLEEVGNLTKITNPKNIRDAVKDWVKIKQDRFNLADDFYKKVGAENYDNELRGIDFDKPVQKTTINKEECLYQYCYKDDNGIPIKGQYFYKSEGIDPNKLGFNTEGRILVKYKVTESIEFLESTAATIDDWTVGSTKVFEGGEIQLFNKQAKSSVTIVSY